MQSFESGVLEKKNIEHMKDCGPENHCTKLSRIPGKDQMQHIPV